MPSYRCVQGNIVAISPEPGVLRMRHQQRVYLAEIAAGTVSITCRCCQKPNVLIVATDGTIEPQPPVFTTP